jgi:MFS transporter, FHS family, glucose/mannose:H+ symporter
MKAERQSPQRDALELRHSGKPALVPILHSSFILTGVVNTMLGPLLPLLSSRWHLSDVRAGNLFVAQFLGSMLGVTASSFLVSRAGPRTSLGAGLFMMAMGSAGLELGSWSRGLLPLFILGIGLGLTIPTTNLLISELYSHKRASALSLINLSWGVGAVICPFLIAGVQPRTQQSLLLYGIAGLLLFMTLGLTQISFPITHPAAQNPSYADSSETWRSRFVPLLGAMFFLYVGTEASIGGWIASYAQRALPAKTTWVITPSYFWGSLLFGRSIAPLLLRYIKESSLSLMGLVVALFAVLASLNTRTAIELGLSTGFAGLGLAAVFPIAIANLSHKFGAAAAKVASLMFNLAGLGGVTLPWLVGFTSTRLGNLKFGLSVPLLGCALMLVVSLRLDPPATFSAKRIA